jgi:hypothetical protein
MDEKENGEELGFERPGREKEGRGKLEVPPVIVKGGSMLIEFPAEDGFDAPEHGKKVKYVKHPKDTKITVVEVRDHKKVLLNSYTLPANLNGKCFVLVWDDSP